MDNFSGLKSHELKWHAKKKEVEMTETYWMHGKSAKFVEYFSGNFLEKDKLEYLDGRRKYNIKMNIKVNRVWACGQNSRGADRRT